MKLLRFSAFVLFVLSFAACKNAPEGEKATTGEAKAAPKTEVSAKSYSLVANTPVVNWTGAKIGGQHTGTISTTGGKVSVVNGAITGGKVNLSMASVRCTDLEGDSKGQLEGHLKSADFFDVEKFPTSTFEITKVTKLMNNDDANAMIFGNLTLKDVTKEVGFKAMVKVSDTGVIVSTPSFTIDRTDFNVKYGSNKFFDGLKDKAINDEVGLVINFTAS